jgi:alpha-N-arabinofuranosidase
MLSFDEYGSREQPLEGILPGRGTTWEHTFDPKQQYIRHDPDNMHLKPQFKPRGGMLDALTSASTLLVLLRHADRVKIGCMTTGLNTLAATNRDHVWKPISHYPFAQLMQFGRGIALRTAVDCDRYDISGYAPSHQFQYRSHQDIDFIDSAAAFNPQTMELAVFVINRDCEQDRMIEIEAGAFGGCRLIEHIQLYSEDLQAMNTYENPDTVLPTVNTDAVFQNGKATAVVRKLSWNVFRFQAAGL